MKIKQLSLFLENKPGALSRPVRLLAQARFNILTLSIAEANQFGILRLILRDWEKRQEAAGEKRLCRQGHRHGGRGSGRPARRAGENSGRAGKGRASTWSSCTPSPKNAKTKAVLVFRFDDPDDAIQVLQKHGVNVVASVDLLNRPEAE